jgi:AmmeMemoRadiSam system protein B/AmmeMemoRadiSam system protein A
MTRNPVVAGQFYPGSAEQLRDMIKTLVDEDADKEDAVGLLVPHAGYVYSGAVAGATFSRIKFGDTFIIMGPSHTGLGRPFSVWTGDAWKTPLGEVAVDTELARRIVATSRHLQEDERAHGQEHAVEVQLPFIQYFRPDVRIVPVILFHATAAIYKEIGRDIARAIKELDRDAVLVASGDMTHYEPQKTAEAKDAKAIDAMVSLDEDGLTRYYEELDISMCAYGPAVSLISAARELGAAGAELVKYQTSGDTTGDYTAVVGYAGIIIKRAARHPLAALARQTVETYVREGRVPPPPAELTPEMEEPSGVFVSIHKLGALRGCIGTFEPQQKNVAAEIIANAVSSATRDPRFPPIAPEELKDLDYSVDVLTRPEPIDDISRLDPKRYGVIVECGWRRGLLLPDLEGVDSAEDQIDICRRKGDIDPDEPVKLYRFEVERYK